VREATLRRISRLSESCNQMLRTASVIGRDFDLPLLRVLSSEIPENEFLGGLDEALGIRIIESISGTSGGYRFGHALIQQAVYEEIAPMRRAYAHGAVGAALEKLHQENPGEHASKLAHHFAEAQAVIGSEKMLRYCLLAGERALASHAQEDALLHFEKGLAARAVALSGTEAAPDEESAALLFGLARAQSATVDRRQLEESFATLSRAFEYYAQAGNVAQAVAVAEFPLVSPQARIPGVAQLLTRALALVLADSPEAGRLLSRYGGILGVVEVDYEAAQPAFNQALAIARREGDVPLEVQTLAYAADVSGNHIHWQECVDNGLRAIELDGGNADTYSGALPRWWVATSLLYLGQFETARAHALVLLELAERPSTPPLLASHTFVPITALMSVTGDWAAGREYSDRGLDVQPLNPVLLSTRVLLEHETGEYAQGEFYLKRLIEAMRRSRDELSTPARTSLAIGAAARITGVTDHLPMAEAAAESVRSKSAVPALTALYVNAGLTLMAVQKGDQAAAEELYAYLSEHRNTMVGSIVSVNRMLGLLSQTMGDTDKAEVHFEDALTFCRNAGYRPELAWTCYDYANALPGPSTSLRGRTGRTGRINRGKAVSLLDESLAISTELGMRPLIERVVALQDQIEAQLRRAPAFPDGLTQREVAVLRPVATGKTDREIAEELFISVATMSTHVRNMLNKTGVANRTEAASYANQQGLIAPLSDGAG